MALVDASTCSQILPQPHGAPTLEGASACLKTVCGLVSPDVLTKLVPVVYSAQIPTTSIFLLFLSRACSSLSHLLLNVVTVLPGYGPWGWFPDPTPCPLPPHT